nr:MAG TPA: hypothetical protein [Caudoviricetes sp.]
MRVLKIFFVPLQRYQNKKNTKKIRTLYKRT